jgi:hypothetical protein
MTPDLIAIWETMERVAGTRTTLRRLTAEYEDALYLGYDPVRRTRLFVVELTEGAQRVVRRTARWRQLRVEQLHTEGAREAVAVSAPGETYFDVFTALVADLYAHLSPLRANRTLADHLLERLEKWQRFLEERPPEGLSWEAQRGLFGELTLLKGLIEESASAGPLEAWKGPEGHVHDFVLPQGDIEVKVATVRERIIHISRGDQLDPPAGGTLHLFVLELEVSETAGTTLPNMVEAVREALGRLATTQTLLKAKLLEAGYADVDAEKYPTRYIVRATHLYCVDDRFPRITKPPEEVFDVHYKLRLTDLSAHRILDPEATLARILRGRQ